MRLNMGGKRSGNRGRGAEGKTVVVGIKQRQGPVKTKVAKDAKTKTVEPFIRENVREGSTVHTDDWFAYRGLSKRGYNHSSVNHGVREWAKGDSHTNSIEGYWSQLKRSIKGTHIHVSARHLPRYLAEFAFRHNHRKMLDLMFAILVNQLCSAQTA